MKLKQKDKYYKVLAKEGAEEADIILYGIIGQEFWWDEKRQEEKITDLSFVQKIRELEEKYPRINIRINSPGGSMYHGNAIVTAIQNSKAEIHTYNDGLAASMAADIWLAAPNRHMAKNSLLMIHSPSSFVIGTAADMRKEADILDKFEQTAIAVMVGSTGMSEEDIKKRFYDYEDHWLSAKEVAEMNLIYTVEDYETESPPTDIEKMNFREVMKLFENESNNGKEDKSLFEQIKEKWTAAFSRRMSATNNQPEKEKKEMKNIEDILAEIDAGTINKSELLEKLSEPNTPPKSEENTLDEKIAAAIEKATKPLLEKMQKLEVDPAAPPIAGVVNQDDFEGEGTRTSIQKELQEINEKIYQSGGGFGSF